MGKKTIMQILARGEEGDWLQGRKSDNANPKCLVPNAQALNSTN